MLRLAMRCMIFVLSRPNLIGDQNHNLEPDPGDGSFLVAKAERNRGYSPMQDAARGTPSQRRHSPCTTGKRARRTWPNFSCPRRLLGTQPANPGGIKPAVWAGDGSHSTGHGNKWESIRVVTRGGFKAATKLVTTKHRVRML